jgi:hypothetical protein
MAVGRDAVLDRAALFRIERIQIWSGQRSQHEQSPLHAGRSAILSVTATSSSLPVATHRWLSRVFGDSFIEK